MTKNKVPTVASNHPIDTIITTITTISIYRNRHICHEATSGHDIASVFMLRLEVSK